MKSNLYLAFLFLFINFVWADATSEYEFSKVPKWVQFEEKLESFEISESNLSRGRKFISLENQINLLGEKRYDYTRIIKEAVNVKGVLALSQLSINFDPLYQRVQVHQIRINRKGKWLDRLKDSKFNLLQRESQLEYQIYDGEKTLNILLNDIQVGDVLDVSYTIIGSNPIFKDRVYEAVYTQFTEPVGSFLYRLLLPQLKQISIREHGNQNLRLSKKELDNSIEYSISGEQLKPYVSDGDTPSWFSGYPWIQLSEYNNWKEVIEWGLELFSPNLSSDSTVKELVAKLTANVPMAQNQIEKIIRFVQEEIRYTGFEMGINSHHPFSPTIVLERKFGDCKDKSLLLVTLLKAINIESEVVLVHSSRSKQLVKWLPTPLAFNHAIVRIHFNNQSYLVDPTITYQRGKLEFMAQPDYRYVLPISTSNLDLVEVKTPISQKPNKSVLESFYLPKGYLGEVRFNVKTVYRGHSSDSMRAVLATRQMKELQKDYVNFYARNYPEISQGKELQVSDDLEKNILTVNEYYKIPSIFKLDEENAYWISTLTPSDLLDSLTFPDIRQRKEPLVISYPTWDVYETKVHSPDDYFESSEEIDETYEGKALKLRFKSDYHKRLLTISYEFQSKVDHVDIEEVPEHIQLVRKMRTNVGYNLYYSDSDKDEPNFSMGSAVVSGLLLFSVLIVLRNLLNQSTAKFSRTLHSLIDFLLTTKGRATRHQFWLFTVFFFAFCLSLVFCVGFVSDKLGDHLSRKALGIVTGAIIGLLFLPMWSGIAIKARRWHDRGKSGWMMLIEFIPIFGPIYSFIQLWIMGSEAGENRFGPNPYRTKNREISKHPADKLLDSDKIPDSVEAEE